MTNVARLNRPGHKFDGKEVIISFIGPGRDPFLDSAYRYEEAARTLPKPVAVIILARGDYPEELFGTFDASDLLITAK